MAVILVVDDEVGIRELLSEILSDEGYSVLLAENAGAARIAINNRPDLVLLDIWMPDNDGVSLLRQADNARDYDERTCHFGYRHRGNKIRRRRLFGKADRSFPLNLLG